MQTKKHTNSTNSPTSTTRQLSERWWMTWCCRQNALLWRKWTCDTWTYLPRQRWLHTLNSINEKSLDRFITWCRVPVLETWNRETSVIMCNSVWLRKRARQPAHHPLTLARSRWAHIWCPDQCELSAQHHASMTFWNSNWTLFGTPAGLPTDQKHVKATTWFLASAGRMLIVRSHCNQFIDLEPWITWLTVKPEMSCWYGESCVCVCAPSFFWLVCVAHSLECEVTQVAQPPEFCLSVQPSKQMQKLSGD